VSTTLSAIGGLPIKIYQAIELLTESLPLKSEIDRTRKTQRIMLVLLGAGVVMVTLVATKLNKVSGNPVADSAKMIIPMVVLSVTNLLVIVGSLGVLVTTMTKRILKAIELMSDTRK